MRTQDGIAIVVLTCLVTALGCGGSDSVSPASAGPSAAAPPARETPEMSPSSSVSSSAAEDFRYRVSLHSTCTANMPDGRVNEIDADASFQYTWRHQGNQAELLLHRIDDTTRLGDQPVIESTRSRERFHAQRGEQVLADASLDNAEPPVREMLLASFDSPLCKITLDENGREVAREVTAAPAAKMVLDDGIIANARLFHGPFPAGKKTWQAPAQISMGGGRFADGTLSYTLIDRSTSSSVAPQDRIPVHVAGELVGGAANGPAGQDRVTYRLDGTQIYDRTLGRWISGEFDVSMTSEIGAEGQKITAAGTTKIEMAMVPAASKPSTQTATRPSATPR